MARITWRYILAYLVFGVAVFGGNVTAWHLSVPAPPPNPIVMCGLTPDVQNGWLIPPCDQGAGNAP